MLTCITKNNYVAGLLFVLGYGMLVCPGAWAQDTAEQADRWREMSYGVSLVPPANTVQYEGPSVVWSDPRGFSISFEIVYSEVPTNVKQFAASAIVQASFALNTPRLITEEGEQATSYQRYEQIAERPATKLFFEIEPDDAEQESRIQGQAIIMLEPYAAAVVKFNAPKNRAELAYERFVAVLESLHVPLGTELNELREQRVDAADAWLKGFGVENMQLALPELQWYRVVFAGKDIGHLRLASTQDPEVLRRRGYQPPGTFAQIDRRQLINGQTIDIQTGIYVAADGKQEEWTTKTTLREGKRERAGLTGGASSALATWAETGVRGDRAVGDRNVHALTVIVDSPPRNDSMVLVEKNKRFVPQRRANDERSSTQVSEWQAPERAYLSQADLWVFAGLLPKEPDEYCFTAYHPRTGKPGLRLVQVVPQADGGVVVRDRPNSRLSAIEYVYDRDGRLLRRVNPDGMTLLPTTPRELATIWDIDFK